MLERRLVQIIPAALLCLVLFVPRPAGSPLDWLPQTAVVVPHVAPRAEATSPRHFARSEPPHANHPSPSALRPPDAGAILPGHALPRLGSVVVAGIRHPTPEAVPLIFRRPIGPAGREWRGTAASFSSVTRFGRVSRSMEQAVTRDTFWHPAKELPVARLDHLDVYREVSPAFAPIAIQVQRSSRMVSASTAPENLPLVFPGPAAADYDALFSAVRPGGPAWQPGSARSSGGTQVAAASRTATLQPGASANGNSEVARAPAPPAAPLSRPTREIPPAASAPSGIRSASNPEDLAEAVLRLVLDRLAIESERRGWQQWT